MDKDIHLLYFFFLDELERVEVFDFAGDPDGKVGYIEPRNRAHGTVAGQQIGPHFFLGIARAADKTNPGYDYAAIQGNTSIPRSNFSIYLACFSMYSMASRTLLIFSASSSAISILNSSSNLLPSAMVSNATAPRSSIIPSLGLTCP